MLNEIAMISNPAKFMCTESNHNSHNRYRAHSFLKSRLLAFLLLFLTLGNFSEAGRTRAVDAGTIDAIKKGTSFRSISEALGSRFSCFGGLNFRGFYKSMSVKERKGFRLLLKAVQEHTGNGTNLKRQFQDLDRLAVVLRPPYSSYNLSLKQFCAAVADFVEVAPADQRSKVARTLAQMMSGTKDSGLPPKLPPFKMVKSGTSESLEMVLMVKKKGSMLDKVQPAAPIDDGKLWREGSFIGGPITGKWELEVKCWSTMKKTSGVPSIKGQIKSDILRSDFANEFLTKPIGEINGRYWRFARAGENNGNFEAFSKAVQAAYEKGLMKEIVLKDPTLPLQQKKYDEMKKKIADWIQDRFKVEETKPEDFADLFPDLITP